MDIATVDIRSDEREIGGVVFSDGGFSTDPSGTITGPSENAFSFVSFDLAMVPDYAKDLLRGNRALFNVSYTASTSNPSNVNIKAFADGDTFGGVDSSVRRQIATPTEANAVSAYRALDDHDSNPFDTFSVRNGHATRDINVTSQVVQAASLTGGSTQKFMLFFDASNTDFGLSTNIKDVSARIYSVVAYPDAISDDGVDVGAQSRPFANVVVSSSTPAELKDDPGIIVLPSNPLSTPFLDYSSVATKATSRYQIVQSRFQTGNLSGDGLTRADGQFGQVIYSFSAPHDNVQAVLRSLVFTASDVGVQETAPLMFTVKELDGLASYTVTTAAVYGGRVDNLTINKNSASLQQNIWSGGVANNTTLAGDIATGDKIIQTVLSGGVANGTLVRGGELHIMSGGISNGAVLDSVVQLNGAGIAKAFVFAGGEARDTVINGTDRLTVLSGGVTDSTGIESGGLETVSSGGDSRFATIASGGRQVVSGVAREANVSGVQEVLAGGAAFKSQVKSTGSQTVAGTSDGGRVDGGGTIAVASGGALLKTELRSGAQLSVADGGRVSELTADAGSSTAFLGQAELRKVEGAGAISKSGAGVLTVRDAGDFSGALTLAGGVVFVSDGSLRSGGQVTMQGGVLEVTAGFRTSRAFTLNAGSQIIQVDAGSADLSGVIDGAGALTKTGAGRLILTGANSFSSVQLLTGALQLGSAASAPSGEITFGAGPQLLAVGGTSGLSNRISEFAPGDSMQLKGLAFSAGETATLTGRTLQVVSDGAGRSFTDFRLANGLTLGQNGLLFRISSDGEGGSILLLQSIATSRYDDVITGGDGLDRLSGSDGDDTISGGFGADELQGNNGADILYGNQDNDFLDGGDGNDALYGGQGNDRVEGGAGDDVLYGNLADDILIGGGGTNRLDGGDGVDTADYRNATVGVTVSLLLAGSAQQTGVSSDSLFGIENLSGSARNDLLTGDTGRNIISGGDGADIVYGGFGDDQLYGNQGDDVLYGNQDADTLYGGQGDDVIYGGQGDDIIFGNAGADILYGNLGNDSFRYATVGDSTPTSFDTLADFASGQDRIDLRAIHTGGANDSYALTPGGGGTVLTVDLGNNGVIDMRIVIIGAAVAADVDWG